MAAWHYHQLSNIRSIWSPSPGNLLWDRTSGAEVINHYTHPQTAVWHLSSRTAEKSHTVDPAWFISRIGKGTAEVSITCCYGERYPSQLPWQVLIYGITWGTNVTHRLSGKRISVKVPISLLHSYLLACRSSSVRMWTSGWPEQRLIYSFVASVLHLVSGTK